LQNSESRSGSGAGTTLSVLCGRAGIAATSCKFGQLPILISASAARHHQGGRYFLDGRNFLENDAVIHGDRVGSSVIIFWTGHLTRVTNGLSGRLRYWASGVGLAMKDFAFKVNLVAVVQVRAGGENVGRKVVPTVLGAPGR
jgi:hypothetical protein